jgi:hypothetical protein
VAPGPGALLLLALPATVADDSALLACTRIAAPDSCSTLPTILNLSDLDCAAPRAATFCRIGKDATRKSCAAQLLAGASSQVL